MKIGELFFPNGETEFPNHIKLILKLSYMVNGLAFEILNIVL